MIDGKSSGNGTYNYESRSCRDLIVHVSSMPESSYKYRITFTRHGEIQGGVIGLSETEAQLLWAALNAVAVKNDWQDFK